MLLDLLKRDLRLHWDVMTLPFAVLALIMGAIGIAHESAAMLGLVLLGSLFVPFLPLAIHLRESSQGTLADLLTLPVSRSAIVALRYVEMLVFAVLMIGLAHLGTWLALCATAHELVRFQVMGGDSLLPIGVLLLLCFAYPMPFTLRWDGKGLAVAFALLSAVWTALALLLPESGPGPGFQRFFLHLIQHPGQVVLGLLGLLLLSYLVSLKAFAARDF